MDELINVLDKAAGSIESLLAEVSALRAERNALRAALEAAREDAERYRWLKKSAFCNVWSRGDGIALVVPRTPTESIDSRIDAAMEQEAARG